LDKTYRLELKFKNDRVIQTGKYTIKDDVLTLIPRKVPGDEETSSIALKLTWRDRNSVTAIATRPNRKPTEFHFYRRLAGEG
jgi:hypothetical protein